jgi:riboflavin kinase / FMN adenylyltransferase
MRVYRSFQDIDFSQDSWVSVGTFDGVHLGHAALLARLMKKSRLEGAKGVLVTFDRHPQNVIAAQGPRTALLTPTAEKLRLLDGFGLDAVVVLAFTEAVSRLSPGAFLDSLRRAFAVRGMVSGTSHGFGAGRGGNAAFIEAAGREQGFSVEVVPPVVLDGENVSSTAIRGMLSAGEAGKASRFLGRFYSIAGNVVKGKGIGTALGFPTANIEPEDAVKLLPKNGVYAVRVMHRSKRIGGTANIGFCPTFGGECRILEVHLHDFRDDIVGSRLSVEFTARLRDERKFESTQALAEQIGKDIEAARRILLNEFFANPSRLCGTGLKTP